MYEITFLDTGETVQWTLNKCRRHFGAKEFTEIVKGYFPNIVAVKIN